MCDVFAHFTHVFQAATCMQLKALQMLMFFWASVFYKNGHKSRVFAAMNIKKLQIKAWNQLFLLHFFSLQLDTWIKSYDVLSETHHIL